MCSFILPVCSDTIKQSQTKRHRHLQWIKDSRVVRIDRLVLAHVVALCAWLLSDSSHVKTLIFMQVKMMAFLFTEWRHVTALVSIFWLAAAEGKSLF